MQIVLQVILLSHVQIIHFRVSFLRPTYNILRYHLTTHDHKILNLYSATDQSIIEHHIQDIHLLVLIRRINIYL